MTFASTLLIALLTAANPSSDGGAPDPILLDFHAEWCGPCQKMAPVVDRLDRQGYPVRKINIDRSPAMAKRYGVDAVPTFIVVDASGREIDRTSGLQPAGELERFYLAARDKAQARAPAGEPDRNRDENPTADDDDRPRRDMEAPARPFANPFPVETTVRIKVQAPHSTGFGTGTIVYSSPEQSIVLTCAHIFKLEGRSRQASPGQFPHPITIELFDGKLHPQPSGPAKARCVAAFPGRAVDYDFGLDVGLIVFRPGHRLPASRVVPRHWQPRSEPLPMKMLTVGCSEGDDATAWHTRIMNPRLRNFLQDQPAYEAIQCENAPKQGRSGGGLFTTDGYIAGVCNFAEPEGNHGLYATPRSIYSILDRNNLSALYAPVSIGSGTLLADGRRPAPSRVARSQSPDRDDDPAPRRRPAPIADGADEILLPQPSLLGIKEPIGSDGDSATPPRSAPGSTRRVAWHPNHATQAETPVETATATKPARPRWRTVDATGGSR